MKDALLAIYPGCRCAIRRCGSLLILRITTPLFLNEGLCIIHGGPFTGVLFPAFREQTPKTLPYVRFVIVILQPALSSRDIYQHRSIV